jgi:hypothetical protein
MIRDAETSALVVAPGGLPTTPCIELSILDACIAGLTETARRDAVQPSGAKKSSRVPRIEL